MPTKKLLLDTNAYLRLATNINPLLNIPFGEDDCRMHVIKEFESEFTRSTHLQSKFQWVMDREFVLNRRRCIRVPLDKRRPISITKNALLLYVRKEALSVSPVDNAALATGRVLAVPVVTDDKDMRRVAHAYKIETMRTLVLLRKLVKCNHISMETVRDIAKHWLQIDDCPPEFISDYRRIFKERHPRIPRR